MTSGWKIAILLIAVLLQGTAIFCQEPPDTTLIRVQTDAIPAIHHSKLEAFTRSRFYQITHAAVPLAVSGIIVKRRDDRYRSLRNEFAPRFNYHYDDYLQFAPGALMIGLKAGGVEGRSSWGRMLVSDGFSAVICATLINSLKYSTKVLRPDGTTYNSFPSGHTAVAFMTATMLHKEYGLTRSPWYSIGGYSLALATGVSRQLNNRHWVSDVMVGAAIGIFSAELGYWLSDLIFKQRGLCRPNKEYSMYDMGNVPSFLGLYMGVSFLIDHKGKSDEHMIEVAEGNRAGVEGAWFWNPYFGIGGRVAMTGLKLKVDDVLRDESMDLLSFQVGPYFSYPISDHWATGANVLLGYGNVPVYDNSFEREQRKHGLCWGADVSITYLPARHLGLRGYLSYNYLPAIRAVHLIGHQTITLGGSVNIMF